MFELSKQKQELLETNGNLIILGGPGSGKTTIALLKAKHEVISKSLKSKQKILFLSFARATVSRVEEQLSNMKLSKDEKNQIEINTYHGFTWGVLKSHGYLLNGIRPQQLLTPSEAASKFADYKDNTDINKEKSRLFFEEGIIHFDLFAEQCSNLFENSQNLTDIYCDTYPIIILDEFQDTNLHEWKLVKQLGKKSRIIALADAEQRIYEFRGADPARIKEYIINFSPTPYDFGLENNRSNGTDIVKFGNDILTNNVGSKVYNDVKIIPYSFIKGNAHLHVKQSVLNSIQRLNKTTKDWSLAILVPSKQLMLHVSDCLAEKQQFKNNKSFPKLEHDVALEKEALALSAILIAGLMEQGEADLIVLNRLINHLIDYIRGRKGSGKITQNDLGVSKALQQYIETGKISGKNRIEIVNECIRIAHQCTKLAFKGNPAIDWVAVRDLLMNSSSEIIKQSAQDAIYLRLLHKGSLLQAGLSDLWREKSKYDGAVLLVRNALLQEHFSSVKTIHKGIHVMTIHKAKGKEFDEVIIYEGIYNGRIVPYKADKNDLYKSQLLLRVAVTRAMKHVTILTPANDKCVLLN